jgi:post-segregation antitoxin (ccd killing protein)
MSNQARIRFSKILTNKIRFYKIEHSAITNTTIKKNISRKTDQLINKVTQNRQHYSSVQKKR